VLLALNESPNLVMTFGVEHPGGEKAEIQVTPGTQPGFSIYGEQTRVGDIEGLLPYARSTQIGVSDPGSLAGKAGLKTGDTVFTFDGKEVSDWEAVEALYKAAPAGQSIRVVVKPGGVEGLAREVTFAKPTTGAANPGAAWGLHSSEMFVEKTVPESPAEKAGLRAGDRLVGVAGKEVQSFFELKDSVQAQGEKSGKVDLSWERDGKRIDVQVEPTATVGKDPLLNKTITYTVGVMPMLSNAPPAMVVERIWNPFVLLYKGTERMLVLTGRNFVSIGKMLGGSVSAKTLGGPIMIGKIAGESLAQGLVAVLTTMGLLSIGLGVLNILPVPVLDGGHLMLLLIESIRGRPLTLRQMEVVQSVGLGLILMLMVLVFKNDITRLVS
jgi:regulator of sigma E protease